MFRYFSLVYLFSFVSPSVWETAQYRLKYGEKGSLNPKQSTKIQLLVHDSIRNHVLMCNDKNYGNTSLAEEINLII